MVVFYFALLAHASANQSRSWLGRFFSCEGEKGCARALSPVKSSQTFGIVYDNPDTAEPDKFKFGICGSVTEDIPDNPQGVQNMLIPGGRCVVVRHHGSHDRIGESIYPLYREWLPKSGESMRDFPLYFHYLNLMPETAELDLITDIYLPLK